MDAQLSYAENISLVWQSQIVRYTGGMYLSFWNLWFLLNSSFSGFSYAVSALVFLLWDIIITFGDEVQYIWPWVSLQNYTIHFLINLAQWYLSQSRRSPTKWVFLFTRYFGVLAQASVFWGDLCLKIIMCWWSAYTPQASRQLKPVTHSWNVDSRWMPYVIHLAGCIRRDPHGLYTGPSDATRSVFSQCFSASIMSHRAS